PDAKGTFSSSGYNLIGASNGSTGFTATGDQTGTVATPLNPMLTSLQNNGGPTDTLALLYGSPALDNGSAFGLTTDQRNSIRPLDTIFANAVGGDGSDIGAVEMNLLGGSDSDGDGMSDDYELFFGVTDAFADADGDGLTNLDEYYAGTNPLDAASALRIISIMSSGNDIRVSFGIAVLGRTYRLERKDSITDPNWGSINGVSDLTPSAIGNAQITDPGAATMTRHVYHVRTLP
ncbi:MAG: choice-of-anchor Q domain-containing protein, partial [Chthoniobacterales bacterium]